MRHLLEMTWYAAVNDTSSNAVTGSFPKIPASSYSSMITPDEDDVSVVEQALITLTACCLSPLGGSSNNSNGGDVLRTMLSYQPFFGNWVWSVAVLTPEKKIREHAVSQLYTISRIASSR